MKEYYYQFEYKNMNIKIANLQLGLRELAYGLYYTCDYDELVYKVLIERSVDMVLLSSYMDFYRSSKTLNITKNLKIINKINSVDDLFELMLENPYFIRTILDSTILLGNLDVVSRTKILFTETPEWILNENVFSDLEKEVYKELPKLKEVLEDLLHLNFDLEENLFFAEDDKKQEKIFMKNYIDTRIKIAEYLLEDLLILRYSSKTDFLNIFKEIIEASLYMSYHSIKFKEDNISQKILWNDFEKCDINELLIKYADTNDIMLLIEIVDMWISYKVDSDNKIIDNGLNENEKNYIKKRVYREFE